MCCFIPINRLAYFKILELAFIKNFKTEYVDCCVFYEQVKKGKRRLVRKRTYYCLYKKDNSGINKTCFSFYIFYFSNSIHLLETVLLDFDHPFLLQKFKMQSFHINLCCIFLAYLFNFTSSFD